MAKEPVAYEQEWELTRKRRIDTLLMDIELFKKTRDAKIVEVNASSTRHARTGTGDVGGTGDRGPAGAVRDRDAGRADLVAAENEAKAQERLATAYRDNRAVLEYELARRRLRRGRGLKERAPAPGRGADRGRSGDSSALSTLLTAQLLPQVMDGGRERRSAVSGGAQEA